MTELTPPLISVCVCTYKRADLLRLLLDGLASQTLAPESFEVVVVDNDAFASAKEVVEQAGQRHPALVLRYDVESMQGISHARNKAVALAAGQLLAFIDDDEQPAANWLADLLATMNAMDADAVLGPVLPRYPPTTRAWVIKSRFFERPRFPTGTVLEHKSCRTGNALVKAQRVKSRRPEAFDTFLSQSGGEDLHFFEWLARQGGRLVWCDTAEVREEVPAARQNLHYMLARSLRVSTIYWQNVNRTRGAGAALAEAALGLGIGIWFALLGLCFLPAGTHRAARRWVTSAKGFGRITALSGASIVGYR